MIILKQSTLQLITLLLFFSSIIQAQNNVSPPTENKAVIYFLRTTNLGAFMNFRFFENSKYFGKFNGTNYIRYECEPGESLFWVKAENIDFIETYLAAGKIYFVEANAVMGGFSAGVKFKLVDYSDEKQMKRINKLLNKKDATIFTQEELEEGKEKMQEIIKNGILKIQKKRKKGKKIKRVEANMDYKFLN